MKKCSKCGELKDKSLFSIKREVSDGLASNCKACCKLYYEKNREILLEKNRLYREANRERLIEKQREAYHSNPELHRLRSKEYVKNNRERVRAFRKKYETTNLERLRKERLARARFDQDTLGDNYLKKVLQNKFNIRASEVTQDMLYFQKVLLNAKRVAIATTPVGFKYCKKCVEIKPFKDFTRASQKADTTKTSGYQGYCRSCVTTSVRNNRRNSRKVFCEAI